MEKRGFDAPAVRRASADLAAAPDAPTSSLSTWPIGMQVQTGPQSRTAQASLARACSGTRAMFGCVNPSGERCAGAGRSAQLAEIELERLATITQRAAAAPADDSRDLVSALETTTRRDFFSVRVRSLGARTFAEGKSQSRIWPRRPTRRRRA